MTHDDGNAPGAQYEDDSGRGPAFSASDRYWITLDGHCALAAHNGQAVQYEHAAGFVYVAGDEVAT